MAPPLSELKPQVVIQRTPKEVSFYREVLSGEISFEMMQIPSGQFEMGSPSDELKRRDNEGPQHPVRMQSFWMGKTPVTQIEWRIVSTFPEVDIPLEPDPSNFQGATLPVECINWHEAVEYCKRLSNHTKRPYRLPSEAEWEYACRAGTTTPFHFGETITTDLANYDGTDNEDEGWEGSYGLGSTGIYRQKTTLVDEFGVTNAFGLSDMHGNVWEWCEDIWHENYQNAPADGSAWLDRGKDEYRVCRGGSWFVYPANCRSASRLFNTPANRDDVIGFRVVSVSRGTP